MTQTTRTRIIKLSEQRARADEIPPALRLLLVTVRRGLLQICDAIDKYLRGEN